MSAEELPLTPALLPEPGRAQDGPTLLRMIEVSRDGRRMLFVDEAGHEFAVDIDDRLRAAIRADSTRRSETPVNNKPPSSSLRPRDIQTRIRAGESAEEVAAAAGTTVEKIMAFAGPVLAEREHMAERAQQASVRRRPGDAPGTARTLGTAVAAHLLTLGLTADDVVTWDSFRRPDGRWKLAGAYETRERSGIAELSYDAPGNFVEVDNDDARWLVGERLEAPAPKPLHDDLSAARRRRAQTPPAPAEPPTAPPPSRVEPVEPVGVDTPVEAYLYDEPPVTRTGKQAPVPPAPERTPSPRPKQAPAAQLEEQAELPVVDEPAEDQKPRRTTARRKRASVPSWDEIMFGGGKQE